MMEHNTDRAGDLEVEDDGPDQAKRQLGVPVCNVIVPDVHQLDLRRRRNKTNTQRRQNVLAEDMFCQSLSACCCCFCYEAGRISYLAESQEIQRYLYILQFVETHAPFLPGL